MREHGNPARSDSMRGSTLRRVFRGGTERVEAFGFRRATFRVRGTSKCPSNLLPINNQPVKAENAKSGERKVL